MRLRYVFFLPTRQQFPDPPLQLDAAFQQRSIRTEYVTKVNVNYCVSQNITC